MIVPNNEMIYGSIVAKIKREYYLYVNRGDKSAFDRYVEALAYGYIYALQNNIVGFSEAIRNEAKLVMSLLPLKWRVLFGFSNVDSGFMSYTDLLDSVQRLYIANITKKGLLQKISYKRLESRIRNVIYDRLMDGEKIEEVVYALPFLVFVGREDFACTVKIFITLHYFESLSNIAKFVLTGNMKHLKSVEERLEPKAWLIVNACKSERERVSAGNGANPISSSTQI